MNPALPPQDNLERPGMVRPGGLLAILGGGQLGRMTAMAARTMGYRVRVMDPEAACPASFVVDETIVGRWDDVDAARRLAAGADAVTLEIEQIGVDALSEVARLAPLRPGVEPIRIIQDKTLQKTWLAETGISCRPISRGAQRGGIAGGCARAGRTRVPEDRTRRLRRPGTGAYRHAMSRRPRRLLLRRGSLGARPAVAEQALDLDFEISVMAARNPSGEVRSLSGGTELSRESDSRLERSAGGRARRAGIAAEALAAAMIAKLGLEGLLCAELFVTANGELFVNELAPRPHNSYHQSERGCVTSQFEQLVRAVCNLPLGSTELVAPAAISNLLGDLWLNGEPNFPSALQVPGVRLHLYEKLSARPGRKMGHLSSVGATAEEALERVLEAKRRL